MISKYTNHKDKDIKLTNQKHIESGTGSKRNICNRNNIFLKRKVASCCHYKEK